MKLSELIEIEKALRDLVYFTPGPNNSTDFFARQNNGAASLGCLVYEIKKLTEQIQVEIKNDSVQA